MKDESLTDEWRRIEMQMREGSFDEASIDLTKKVFYLAAWITFKRIVVNAQMMSTEQYEKEIENTLDEIKAFYDRVSIWNTH